MMAPSGAASLFTTLQLGDAFFPSGRYALSHGIERFVEQGRLQSADDVESLLADYIGYVVAPSDATAAAQAARATADGDLATLIEIDRRLLAMKLPAESCLSSRRTGRSLHRIAGTLSDNATLGRYSAALAAGETPGNYSVVFGALAASLGLEPFEVALVELYSFAVNVLGASLRLIRMDHADTQAILRTLMPMVVSQAMDAVERRYTAMWSFAPAIEIAQMQHEGSHSRMFAS